MIEATKTFTMAVPFEHEGTSHTSVTLRRPKGREIRAMRNGATTPGINGDLTFQMMSDLSELPQGVFDEMDGGDLRKIEAWLEALLGN